MKSSKNNLTNSSKSPLIGTKQEGKNNTASDKGRTLCVCVTAAVMTQCFSVHSVTASTKGPGPPRYKGQNQWSFGKTDGKPPSRGVRLATPSPPAATGADAPVASRVDSSRASQKPLQSGDRANTQITKASAANERDTSRGQARSSLSTFQICVLKEGPAVPNWLIQQGETKVSLPRSTTGGGKPGGFINGGSRLPSEGCLGSAGSCLLFLLPPVKRRKQE